VALLKNNDGWSRFTAVPLGSEVAVTIGEIGRDRFCARGQMRLRLALPKLIGIPEMNPACCMSDIDNDELNRPNPKQGCNVVICE
jgi:hypothetical protein